MTKWILSYSTPMPPVNKIYEALQSLTASVTSSSQEETKEAPKETPKTGKTLILNEPKQSQETKPPKQNKAPKEESKTPAPKKQQQKAGSTKVLKEADL